MAMLEVFIHDPLYRWMVSPLEAARRQRQRGNEAAPEGNNNDNNGLAQFEGPAITTAIAMEEGKPEAIHAAQDAAMLGRNGAMDELGVGGGGGGSMEEAAERMLTRIRQKLQG